MDNLMMHRSECTFNGLSIPSAPCEEHNDENRQFVSAVLDDVFGVLEQQIMNRNEARDAEQPNDIDNTSSPSRLRRLYGSFSQLGTTWVHSFRRLCESLTQHSASCMHFLTDTMNDADDDVRFCCKMIGVLAFAFLLLILMLFVH